MVERLIASGKDLGDLNAKVRYGENEYTALEIARGEGETQIALLLERFLANPAQTRHEVRVELAMLGELAAEVFALVIFLCDDLLQPKLVPTPDVMGTDAAHFFFIAKRFPMELQMILCHRAVGSAKDGILSKDSEAAFKSLVMLLS